MWIDSSVFLENALEQRKWRECNALLQRVAEGEKAYTSDYCIYSVILVMLSSKAPREAVSRFVNDLYSMQGLELYRPSLDDLQAAFEIGKAKGLDFDDALVVASMNAVGVKKLATLDKEFKKAGVELVLPL